MKKIFLALVVTIAFASCSNFDKSPANNSGNKSLQTSASKPEVPQERDVTITPANSYNDMFVDSTAVETFIKNKNVSAADAQSVKNFYNPRNYGFAWFFKDGKYMQQKAGFL